MNSILKYVENSGEAEMELFIPSGGEVKSENDHMQVITDQQLEEKLSESDFKFLDSSEIDTFFLDQDNVANEVEIYDTVLENPENGNFVDRPNDASNVTGLNADIESENQERGGSSAGTDGERLVESPEIDPGLEHWVTDDNRNGRGQSDMDDSSGIIVTPSDPSSAPASSKTSQSSEIDSNIKISSEGNGSSTLKTGKDIVSIVTSEIDGSTTVASEKNNVSMVTRKRKSRSTVTSEKNIVPTVTNKRKGRSAVSRGKISGSAVTVVSDGGSTVTSDISSQSPSLGNGSEKNCVCHQCNRTFTGPKYLKLHVRVHGAKEDGAVSAEKPSKASIKPEVKADGVQPDKAVAKSEQSKPGYLKQHVHPERASFRKPVPLNTLDKPGVAPLSNASLTCGVCNKVFQWPSKMKRHMKIHGDEKKAAVPSKPVPRKEVTAKIAAPAPPTHACGVCSKVFASLRSLGRHKKVHDDVETKAAVPSKPIPRKEVTAMSPPQRTCIVLHTCIVCSKVFASSRGLRRHKKVHDDVEAKTAVPRKPVPRKEVTAKTAAPAPPTHACGVCSKVFGSSRSLGRHKKVHDDEEKVAGKPPKGDEPKKPQETDKKPKEVEKAKTPSKVSQSNRCGQCRKMFSGPDLLRKHLKSHDTTDRKFTCGICGMKFVMKAHLSTHLAAHDQSAARCTVCSEEFEGRSLLEKHVRKVHPRHGKTVSKTHRCQECNHAFYHRRDLDRHERTHTGEKPYKCTQCPSTFARDDYLSKHFRLHTGETPYKCDSCDDSFMYRGNLVKHIRSQHGKSSYGRGNPSKNKESAKKPIRKPAERLTKEPVEKSTKKAAKKPVKKSEEKAAKEPVEKSAKEPVKKSEEKAAKKPVEKSEEKAAKKPVEKSAEKAAKESVEKSVKKPVKESAEKAAKENVDKLAKKTTKESVKKRERVDVKKATKEKKEVRKLGAKVNVARKVQNESAKKKREGK